MYVFISLLHVVLTKIITTTLFILASGQALNLSQTVLLWRFKSSGKTILDTTLMSLSKEYKYDMPDHTGE